MSVHEIGTLHQRYIELSGRFKSAWTFHQFLQGLHKLLMDGELAQHSAEFQATYGLLKEVSGNLSSATTDRVRNELEMVDRRLQELNRWLVQEDSRVSPSLMRMFFQRVRNYNEAIILQLVKFYLFIRPQIEWGQDHNDKVDFLVTKLAEEAQGPQGPWILRSRSQIRETLASLWKLANGQEVSSDEVAALCTEMASLKRRISETSSFDELIEQRLIRHYRSRKLDLGPMFFHPDVLVAIVEANLGLRNHIQQLYRREEQKIVADYQRIFELEQQVPVDQQLDVELGTFRQEVESFERSLQQESLSLEELGRLREHVRSLIPRLTRLQESQRLLAGAEGLSLAPRVAEAEDASPEPFRGPDHELVGVHHAALLRALEDISGELSPKLAAVSPDLFSFRLEPREVVAYRRLSTEEGDGSPGLEAFLLRAAALRTRLAEEGEEIRGILDDTAVTRDAPVFQRARDSVRLADRYLRRLDHEIDAEVLEGSVAAARELQVLRMRLVQEMAGIWLLIHRP
jgi:hypothetical protein